MMEQDVPQERSSEMGEEMTEERFLKDLYLYMKERGTPIERIPHLGFKQIDMFLMYKTVKELGGYQQVTTQQLWKKVYNILGGNPRSTSAATCTRRHYEKLLLPYECQQTGYRDDIVFRTPRTQKRFHTSGYDFEHEYPRNGKQPDFRHLPAFHQVPNMFTEHQRRIFSMPLNTAPYFPHGSSSVPNFMALREAAPPHLSLNPSQDLPRAPSSFLAPSSVEVQSCKQSLDMLRYLAKEYKSSTGLEEPLNLSRRENRLETLSDTPSSFSPPCPKKPKFLNEASPLYPPRGPSTEESAEQGETSDGTPSLEGGAGSVRAGPSPVKPDVIDLTSPSNANPVPRRASPPSASFFKKNYSDAFAMKAREREFNPFFLKEESSAASTPKFMNRSNPPGHHPLDPNGNMEIQIPLKLLQELIRRGLANPGPTGNGPAFQDPTKAEAELEHKSRSHSETSESSSTCEEPTNLSLKSIPQDSNMKKVRLFRDNGIPAESKVQMISSFHLNSSLKLSMERDALRVNQLKQVHNPIAKKQESMNSRPPSYSEDTPLSLAMRPGRKPEKEMPISSIGANENSTSPPLPVIPDHLKFLLANMSYRLEGGQTF